MKVFNVLFFLASGAMQYHVIEANDPKDAIVKFEESNTVDSPEIVGVIESKRIVIPGKIINENFIINKLRTQ